MREENALPPRSVAQAQRPTRPMMPASTGSRRRRCLTARSTSAASRGTRGIRMRILPLGNGAGMPLTISYGHARHVVVTDEAIITVERRSAEERRQASIAALIVGGGMMGALLATLVDQLGLPGGPMRLYLRPHATPDVAEMTEVLTCWASEVPAELLNEHRWPRVEAYRPVTFYPRTLIESLV